MATEEQESQEPSTPSPKKGPTLLIFLSLVVGIVLLSAAVSRLIGNAGEKVEQTESPTATQPMDSANLPNGEAATPDTQPEDGARLPEEFPSDTPLYPGARITAVAANEQTISVTSETTASLTDVAAYYERQLRQLGWEIEESAKLRNAVVVSFQKAARTGVVAITESENQTSITLSLDLVTE